MSDPLPFSGLARNDHAIADPAPPPLPHITNLLVELSNGALFVVSTDDILEGQAINQPHPTDTDIVFHLLFRARGRDLIPRIAQITS